MCDKEFQEFGFEIVAKDMTAMELNIKIVEMIKLILKNTNSKHIKVKISIKK